MSVIYCIRKFDPVFIKSDNRKQLTRSEHGKLHWVSWPTSFDSSGVFSLLEEFDPITRCALYGAFAMLVQIAAVAPTAGTLCDHRGNPFSVKRLSAQSHGFVPPELFETLIEWGLRSGWIEVYSPDPAAIPPLAGLRNGTEQDETLRNGTERDSAESHPGRAGRFENSEAQEAQETQIKNLKQQPEPTSDRPESLTLAARSRSLPLLKDLGNMPLAGSGLEWHGSVFADDRLRAHHITEAPAAFFIKWYLDQLSATRPVFKNGNRGQLCFVLAAVYAVRRCTDASLRGTKRIARWCHWVRTFETNQITNADFARAAKEIASHFDSPPKSAASDTPAAASAEYTPDPVVLENRKNKVAELRKKLQSRSKS
jgi:hypothetical protein